MSLLSPAPDAPAILNHTNVAPDMSHGPKVNLTWSRPLEANGIISSYTLFYGHEKDKREETFGKDTLSYSVDVLGGLTYQFHVRAVTIKPGENASLTVNVPEYGTRFSFDQHSQKVKKGFKAVCRWFTFMKANFTINNVLNKPKLYNFFLPSKLQ